MFGDIGKKWLDTIPNIIQKYIDMFNLKDVHLIDDLTYNILTKKWEYKIKISEVSLPENAFVTIDIIINTNKLAMQ